MEEVLPERRNFEGFEIDIEFARGCCSTPGASSRVAASKGSSYSWSGT
jgi:hypothetical protein